MARLFSTVRQQEAVSGVAPNATHKQEHMMMDDPSKIADQTKGVRLHKTNDDIKNNAKAASTEALQARPAEGIDLALVTKQAHWNLKEPQFIGVHLMLDGFRDEQDEWKELMAERIAQLGGTARGTVQEVTRETKLQLYLTDIYATADHIRALTRR